MHDAPDLHLGLAETEDFLFSKIGGGFVANPTKLKLHPSKTFEPDFQMHPKSNYFIIIPLYSIHFFPISSNIKTIGFFPKQKLSFERKPLSLNLALSDCELRRRPISASQRDSTLSQRSSNSSSQGSSNVAAWGKAMTFGEPPLLRVVGPATLVMDTWVSKIVEREVGMN